MSFFSVKSVFIKNQKLPACVNCKFYRVQVQTYKNGRIINENGKCTIFGEKNLESGEIIFRDAIISRLNNNECRPEGVYFEQLVKLN